MADLCPPCQEGEHSGCFRKNWEFDTLAADSTRTISRDCHCPTCNAEN